MTNKVNQRTVFLIPMPIEEDARRGFGFSLEEVHYILLGDHKQRVVYVETEDELVYRGCMDVLWAELKREERERKPYEINSDRHTLRKVYHKIADEDVGNYIPSQPLSLDLMIENNSMRIAVKCDPSVIVERRIRNEALIAAAMKESKTAAIIARMLLKDPECPEKVLMEATGIKAQTTLNYQKQKTKDIIREEFKNWL